MTNQDILKIAMTQSAIDSHCSPEDFMENENKVVISEIDDKARRYLALPFICDLTTYGRGVVASVSEALVEPVTMFLAAYKSEHCFEMPNLLVLQDFLAPQGLSICFMAEYFLPDLEALKILKHISCAYEVRILTPADFDALYLPEWSNALCESRRHLDVLGVGAYDGDILVGLAGCSADCETMWQIGVDVLPDYRHKGIASAITSRLAIEVLNHNKVPFYCCAWSNISSVRNALKSGFRPAWVQMTVKPRSFVDQMNKHICLD